MGASRIFRRETALKPIALLSRKPRRTRRPIRQIEKDDESEKDRRQRLENEQPLPACKPLPTMKPEERRRDRRADRGRERNGGHEIADDPATIGGGKPERQKEDDAGEESCFGEPKQKAKAVERVLRAEARPRGDLRDKGHCPRDYAP